MVSLPKITVDSEDTIASTTLSNQDPTLIYAKPKSQISDLSTNLVPGEKSTSIPTITPLNPNMSVSTTINYTSQPDVGFESRSSTDADDATRDKAPLNSVTSQTTSSHHLSLPLHHSNSSVRSLDSEPLKKSAAIPSPLNLPKRFVKPQIQQNQQALLNHSNQSNTSNPSTASSTQGSPIQKETALKARSILPDSPKSLTTIAAASKDNTNFSNLQSIQQNQQIQSMNPYQQMFYNPQTGQVVALPVSTPHAGQYMQQQQIQQIQQIQQPQQPVMMVPPSHTIPLSHQRQQIPMVATQNVQPQVIQPQQIMYVRAMNGQLIPVLTPASAYTANKSHSRSESPLNNKRGDSVSPSSNPKRQKPSPTSNLTSIQAAEKLQKQQIQLQTQMHPDLNMGLEVPNVSDVYVDNNNNETLCSAPSANNTSNNTTASLKTSDSVDDNDDTARRQFENESLSLENIDNPVQNIENGEQEKKPPMQKVIGTLTLGSFTYKYSQTLSGNLTKDRELFDRLADNAWNSCIAKR